MVLLPNKEVPFAKGEDFTETGRMRVTYKHLNGLQPQSRFPVIYHAEGNDSVTELHLTPDEGRWLADALTRMFRD